MPQRRLAVAGIVFVGSVWVFMHYLGAAGWLPAVAWPPVAAFAVETAARRATLAWTRRALVAAGVVTVAVFAVVYPRLDGHTPAHGTDRDDDADVAVLAAAHGHYPYEPRTYLDNPITHLPGSLLVASPFVEAGGSALENIVVLAIGGWVLVRKARDAEALVLVAGTVSASAGVWHELLTGATRSPSGR